MRLRYLSQGRKEMPPRLPTAGDRTLQRLEGAYHIGLTSLSCHHQPPPDQAPEPSSQERWELSHQRRREMLYLSQYLSQDILSPWKCSIWFIFKVNLRNGRLGVQNFPAPENLPVCWCWSSFIVGHSFLYHYRQKDLKYNCWLGKHTD